MHPMIPIIIISHVGITSRQVAHWKKPMVVGEQRMSYHRCTALGKWIIYRFNFPYLWMISTEAPLLLLIWSCSIIGIEHVYSPLLHVLSMHQGTFPNSIISHLVAESQMKRPKWQFHISKSTTIHEEQSYPDCYDYDSKNESRTESQFFV